ncbi:HutD family protein [Verminephrobacter aporrectodeae subsp. tuberculatae]|nr:HutD family protein [Verminephrobacter aporrectodeae subsp. tuberculatae]MCW5290061.1 HutD family protein [Verminephrobacter aporrectodeae subsp. tuberculatae]MCW8176949.1 HutD family protein [Verminephrobacter aporrectodeae subsp. tuberculatae]MCW8204427.1 HutD family protein [Verminephrobacter aporrectodeae subsp. tuberculatae]
MLRRHMNILALPAGITRFVVADMPPETWANGGGTTRTVAKASGPTHDDWIWRVSVAKIEQSGPFSVFNRTDRQLTLLEGTGLTLETPKATTGLHKPGDSLCFAGDVPVRATLAHGPVDAWNVMWKRGLASCHSTLYIGASGELLELGQSVETIVVVLEGSDVVRLQGDGCEVDLLPGEGIWLNTHISPFQIRSGASGCAVLVTQVKVET